ncbi:MAG TPA: hypothetical protein PLB07_00775 [Bacteroidales bacterium]|nr:hypothetical protein [Bacteroidales bacterium]MDI9532935.1 hypothetical protein [Bacteroidota bacterium]MBP7036699.1 hypothetical protein [Bacteroidales bacterium]MBP8709707.1 hypothetical protein [Bacteroidales bacterium]HOC04059.1 hypothetical protein [Bacteroidales bacterium]
MVIEELEVEASAEADFKGESVALIINLALLASSIVSQETINSASAARILKILIVLIISFN